MELLKSRVLVQWEKKQINDTKVNEALVFVNWYEISPKYGKQNENNSIHDDWIKGLVWNTKKTDTPEKVQRVQQLKILWWARCKAYNNNNKPWIV